MAISSLNESPLLLAVSDGQCSSPHLSPFENKLGGFPDFFPEVSLAVPPSCSNCHGVMLHLLQAYCPLDGSPYHRLLHIFCCSQPSCWTQNGWLVLRSQKRDAPPTQSDTGTVKVPLMTGVDWCNNADDWGTDTPDVLLTSILPTFTDITTVTESLDQLNISGASEHSQSSLGPLNSSSYPQYNCTVGYPSYYICVLPFTDLAPTTTIREIELMEGYYQENPSEGGAGGGGGGGGWGGEVYERMMNIDRKFLKFKEEMSKCPHQLIRYQRGGHPLLLQDASVIPSCQHCGSPLVFELQLLPQIIYLLQEGLRNLGLQDPLQGALTLPVVEYGTVLVYTCMNSCWKEGKNDFCIEFSVVQQVDETDTQ